MPTKEPYGFRTKISQVFFYGIIGAGLVLLGYQYIRQCPTDTGVRRFVSTSGYTVVIVGVLVCLLVALIRWRAAEDDDGRRPKFTAGVVLVMVGAVMMLGSLHAPAEPVIPPPPGQPTPPCPR